MVGGGRRYEPDFSTTYDLPKTIKKTIQNDDDDTHTLRAPKASLEALVEELTKTVCVLKGEVVNNPQEEEGWRKVGVILSDELTKTAKVTDINSIPAFLAEHLRRVFKHPKSEKNKPKLETTENRTAANTTQKVLPASLPPRSAYSFAECLQYAENLQAVGHRIHNPGGLATSLFQSGLSDTLIAEFLQPKVTLGTTNEANQSPRRLPEEKLAAETKTINELIASGMYTVTDIEENFGAYLHPQDWQEIQSRIRTDQNKAANQTHS